MKTVAIIAEYNPFHSGHKYQIDKIREEFGADTRIIAIMSGGYTQRGEIALAPKQLRAKWALDCGVNLVLELPFPYSMASAELFATAGVTIADKLGVVDTLSFGSESGDCTELYTIAKNMISPEFSAELLRVSSDDAYSSLGYPKLVDMAYRSLFSGCSADISLPNNILAIEYMKAILSIGSKIQPHTVKRLGAGYNESEIAENAHHQSATAIRNAILSGERMDSRYLPENIASEIEDGIKNGVLPLDEERLSSAIISHFLLNNRTARKIHDADGGLYNRIAAKCREATSISSLCELSQTKKYTSARIRRAIWFSFFGVTSSDVKSAPRLTRVLAADEIGRQLLKEIKKINGISVITKPTAEDGLTEDERAAKLLSDKADLILQLAMPKKAAPADALRLSPYIKK